MSKCWYCNEELTTVNSCDEYIGVCTRCYASMFKVGNEFVKGLTDKIAELEEKLAEYSKHHEWVSEFLERYKIDPESTPEYSENPMIEYCEQVYDFRLCDNVEIKDLQEQLADYKKDNEQLEDRLHTAEQETLHFQNKYFDMQQQLTEKEKEIENWKYMYESVMQSCHNGIEEDKRLEKLLAEKDEEIITLNCVISEIHSDLKELREFKVGYDEYDLTDSDARFSLQCDLLNNEQDKISFAVEQLEKVKEELDKHDKIETFIDIYGDGAVNRSDLEFFIDNQIEQLKKEMK